MPRAHVISTLLRRFTALTGVVAIAAFAALSIGRPGLTPIRSDGYSYHVYLPAWLIYNQLDIGSVADDCCGGEFPGFTAITRWPSTGRWLNAHPIGVAILSVPFFVAAHAVTRWSNLPPDGFTLYYQIGAALSGIAYMLAGLAALRHLLRRHVSDGVALATLAIITFGTNLPHYGVNEASFSHAYSFGLVCILLVLTERWWERPDRAASVGLGAVAGLLILVRHANLLYLLVVPLYGVVRLPDVATQARRLSKRSSGILVASAVCAAALIPQLCYYRYVTGSWLVFSYSNIHPTWTSPHVWRVLFSVQKGLFFWSPALLFALPGFFLSRGSLSRWVVPASAVLVSVTLLISCWGDWQFGASFGHRGFTDALGLCALPMAATFAWIVDRPRLVRVVAPVVVGLVALSLAQLAQYWLDIIPTMDTTWEQYRQLFLRF